jgi:Flp pilus assembly protein TadG
MRSRVNFVILLACTLSRLRRDRRGTSSIEFALVAPLFLVGTLATLEIALSFVGEQLLSTATQDTTRLIMTGQVTSSSTTKEDFQLMVCERVKALLDCSQLYIDAQAYSSMAEPTFDSPIEDNKFVDNTKFITGKQGDIVVVRTFYKWPVYLTSFFGYNSSNLEGSRRLITASAAVRNEPW